MRFAVRRCRRRYSRSKAIESARWNAFLAAVFSRSPLAICLFVHYSEMRFSFHLRHTHPGEANALVVRAHGPNCRKRNQSSWIGLVLSNCFEGIDTRCLSIEMFKGAALLRCRGAAVEDLEDRQRLALLRQSDTLSLRSTLAQIFPADRRRMPARFQAEVLREEGARHVAQAAREEKEAAERQAKSKRG